jgi:predicted Zn-dependent protease with MMP-like domain
MALMSAPGSASSRRPHGPRAGRDRHGRGLRGPLAWPAVPAMRTRRDRFDDIVRDVAEDLDRHLEPRGLVVEYAAMDIPTDLGPQWSPEVPLARTVAATKTTPARIIAFRRPIETRAAGQTSLVALVRSVLTAEVSSLFAIPPEELDDGFDDEDG